MPACINKHSEPKQKNEINNILSLTKTRLIRNLLLLDIQLLIMNIRKLIWNLSKLWAEIILQITENNHLFLTQEKLKKKLLIVNMENIWAEVTLQLELELQLLIKNQIIEIIPLVDTVVAEKLVALINLWDTHILKLCFRDTRRTFNKSLRTRLSWKTERLLI